jgi:hypothetical protein
VIVCHLQRINRPQDFVKVTSGAGGVGDHQAYFFIRVNHEQRPDGQAVIGIRMNHVVKLGHFAILIGNDREIYRAALSFVDVADPLGMRFHRVHAQGDGFHITLGKFAFQLGGQAQLGGAHRREVRRMGKQNAPAVAKPLMKADGALTGFLFEVRCGISQS